MIRVGINGFGRIGRALTRIISSKRKFKIVLINDVDQDIKNLSYLFKYDSIYGKFLGNVSSNKNFIKINNNKIKITSKMKINEVPWSQNKTDIVIDSSGTSNNVTLAKKVLKNKVKKIIITHSPKKNIDYTMILGVNEKNYNHKNHKIIRALDLTNATKVRQLTKGENNIREVKDAPRDLTPQTGKRLFN